MMNRRQFMKATAAMAGIPLLNRSHLLSAAQAAARPSGAARAKSIIQIWMWGGPCHLDTFDPKPEAGSDFCGPLAKPIETNVSGIRICEQLPMLAKQADKYSIIRCMTHGVNAHLSRADGSRGRRQARLSRDRVSRLHAQGLRPWL